MTQYGWILGTPAQTDTNYSWSLGCPFIRHDGIAAAEESPEVFIDTDNYGDELCMKSASYGNELYIQVESY